MSNRRIPFKFVVIALVGLAALAVVQISDDDRKLLLIGWTLIFFGVMAFWQQQQEFPVYRRSPSTIRHIQPLMIEELYDHDRAALQHDHHVWNSDSTADSSKEIV